MASRNPCLVFTSAISSNRSPLNYRYKRGDSAVALTLITWVAWMVRYAYMCSYVYFKWCKLLSDPARSDNVTTTSSCRPTSGQGTA